MPLPATIAALRVFMLLAALPSTGHQVARLAKGAYEFWSGKKIAVLGPSASGKDSFIARLQGREIPLTHEGSPMAERVTSFEVKVVLSRRHAIDIKCKGVINTGGDVDFRDDPGGWLAVCEGADVVFYVMTVDDLLRSRFLRRGRVRSDLAWLQTVFPQLEPHALVHVLINKVDEKIASHTHYGPLVRRFAKQLTALDGAARRELRPYDDRYTGATLISMKNKAIFTLAIHQAFRAVYSAFHEHEAASRSLALAGAGGAT